MYLTYFENVFTGSEVDIKSVQKYKNVYMREVFTDKKIWISLVAMQTLNLIIPVQSQ